MDILLLANSYSSYTISKLITEARNNTTEKVNETREKDVPEKHITTIHSQEQYLNWTTNVKNKPDYIFIVPELNWTDTASAFEEGYQKATELITAKLKDHFFQLIFLSIADTNQLLAHTPLRYHSLIKSFPHYCILEFPKRELIFDHYSPIHFQLIKSLVLADEGRLSQIEHDYSAIKNNAQAVQDDTQTMRIKKEVNEKVLNELMLFQQLNEGSLRTVATNVNSSNEILALKNSFDYIDKLIQDIKVKIISNSRQSKKPNRSPYSVLIIEDDKEERKVLSEIFANHYQTVFPSSDNEIESFRIHEAIGLIIKERTKYQIVILDLLYKDDNNFWLPFNGLDLYNTIRKYNRFACVRFVTSLPRDIVAKIAGQLLQTDLRIDQVFTKAHGNEALKYIIQDRIIEINNECEENSKLKSSFEQLPSEGVFKWNGVVDWTLELLVDNKEAFNKHIEAAKSLFALFKKHELHPDTPGWNNGVLISPKRKTEITQAEFLKKFTNILTHRLLVINYALQNKKRTIDSAEFEREVLEKVKNPKGNKPSSCDKTYLITNLGFHITSSKNKDGDEVYAIELRNLFSHEEDFISGQLANFSKDESLTLYPELFDWFVCILINQSTCKNWKKLNLSYNPYKDTGNRKQLDASDITPRLTLHQLTQFLNSLVEHKDDPEIVSIIDYADEMNNINEEKVNIPREIKRKIDQLSEIV